VTRRHAVAVASTTILFLVTPSPAWAARPDPCGVTTLDATITDLDGDGVLECGPGDDIVVRDDLARPSRDRADTREPLLSLLLLADLQLGDEELTLPSRTDWRDYPALMPHLANAQMKAANRLIVRNSPVLGSSYDMAFALGDLADNAQLNETRLVIDLMDGHHLVDPDSGADGYDGEKPYDPRGAGDIRTPVRHETILDLANEPFYAQGLRNADGSPLPWYAVHGNHDSKVMGGIPHDHADWQEAAEDWATGDKKIFRLNVRYQRALSRIRHDAPQEEAAFWMRIFDLVQENPAAVGDVRTIPPDEGRHILSREEWMKELNETTGAPVGHGFGADTTLCPDVYDDAYARRACYAFDHKEFRFIVLDDNALEGYTTGSIDRPQFEWLEQQMIGASSVYVNRKGKRVTNDGVKDRYIVVLSHHTTRGMTNDGTHGEPFDEHDGEDVKHLLLRFPNVLVHANGHSHSNRLWAHASKRNDTRYWEINTASVADNPHNSRSVEIARNGDGTLSIFGVLFENAVHPDPRAIDWTEDDPTDEVDLGGDRNVNEDWLAAVGMEEAARDSRDYRYGKDDSRNVELLLPDPLTAALVTEGSTSPATPIGLVIATLGGLVYAALRRGRRKPMPPVRPPRRRTVTPDRDRTRRERIAA
jgi:metallophosphoesterase (TIGR03767 family)